MNETNKREKVDRIIHKKIPNEAPKERKQLGLSSFDIKGMQKKIFPNTDIPKDTDKETNNKYNLSLHKISLF